jgi:hypothetical protein
MPRSFRWAATVLTAPTLVTLVMLGLPEVARADDAACISASEQALTLRQKGKLRDVLKPLADCAAAACPAEIRAECAKRIEAVTAETPTLILGARDADGNDLATAKVTVDGTALPDALVGRPLSFDPGEHVVVFEAPGRSPLTRKLVLRQGEKDRREIFVLAPLSAAGPPPIPKTGTWSTQRTLALVTGGVGLVGLGLGAAFGAYAASAQSKEKSDCSATSCASHAQGTEDYNTAVKDANASTGALVAGGVLVAVGLTLWFTAPKTTAAAPSALRLAPRVGTSGIGLTLGADL